MSDLRDRLAHRAPSLRVIADQVLAETRRIDCVAVELDGAVVAVLDAEPDDLTTVARALAAIEWLTPRLPDWCQLAPELGIDSSLPVRALLLARKFDPDTVAAARRIGTETLSLVTESRAAAASGPNATENAPETIPTAPEGPTALSNPVESLPSRPSATVAPRLGFRTGLRDADLGLSEQSG